MGGGLGRVTHHPEYYLSDGSISFLTAGILFRIHRSFLERESEVFRELFAHAAEDDPQSGTDARPFTLDVSPDEFSQLLWVWYDREYSYRQQSKENWLIILRLATRWRFDKIRELAIRELEFLELPPAERISIYNEHGIDGERLLASYVELCKSPTVPSEADARLLQMEALIHVLQAREDGQRKAVEMGHGSPTSACLEDEALREIVTNRLKKGLNPRSSGTSTGSGDQASDLNVERTHRTPTDTTTITMGPAAVPDRKTQTTASRTPLASHLNNISQTGDNGKGSQEKEQGAGSNSQEKVKKSEGGQDENKLTKEEREKAKQNEEKEAKEKEQKAEQKPARTGHGRSRRN